MNIEDALATALGTLVAGRAYPAAFPQNCLWPAIRFTFVAADFDADICGDGGDDTANHRVQVDGVAATYDAMRLLRRGILTAMATLTPPAVAASAVEDFEADEKRHRVTLEFLVQPSSAA